MGGWLLRATLVAFQRAVARGRPPAPPPKGMVCGMQRRYRRERVPTLVPSLKLKPCFLRLRSKTLRISPS